MRLLTSDVDADQKPMNISLMATPACEACPIRHRAVCARCDDTELARLETMKSYKSFAAGEQILWRGEELEFIASVVVGVATLGKTLEDGRTQMVGLLLPSDLIGRPGRNIIDFDVVAATDVTLCCFQRKPFEKLIEDTPHVAQRLVEMALDELDAARDWMLLLGRKTAREKIATFLHMLILRQHPGALGQATPELTLPLTRDAIANYLGLTLETVSRQMNRMKSEGILRFSSRRRVDVVDVAALQAATGDDSDGGLIA